jgi:protein BCP1
MSNTAATGKRKAIDSDVDADREDEDDSDEDDDDSSEDEELILEGVMVRNPDVSDEEDYETTSSEDDTPPVVAQKKSISKKKKKRKNDDDTLQVDFTFCDMDEKYFHGLKSLLHSSSTVYQAHSSTLADRMIDNVAVGTIVGTSQEDENEADVFGFASVLNVATDCPSLQYLKTFCSTNCPVEHRAELDVVLSGTTKRPAGFLLHGRMINMPLEIVLTLQEQLILDLDWAVENADEEEDRKTLDFGVFIRLAPGTKESNGSIVYKYFDDELLQGRAEVSYTVAAPKTSSSREQEECVTIMVFTKTGHRAAIEDLTKMIRGSSS